MSRADTSRSPQVCHARGHRGRRRRRGCCRNRGGGRRGRRHVPELTNAARRQRAAFLWAFNTASAGPKASFKSYAEALGLPGDNKEEENIRKRSAKYREAAGKFLVEVWLVEALKIVTNLTLRAAEATHNFRVELAARLYFRQLYMQHDGPFETFDGTPILLDDAARLCSLEVHEDGDESADVAAVNAVVTSWRTGTTPSPRLP